MTYTKKILIIGSSAAGIAAATKLRVLDKEASITCLTAENSMPYNRCLLAEYLMGAKSREQLMTKDQLFFDQNAIDFRTNSRVIELDSQGQSVITSDQKEWSYDYLFIGTGRESFLLSSLDQSISGQFLFYTLDDVRKIRHYLDNNPIETVAIIGGGLTGLECATALAYRKIKTVIIEKSSQLLGAQIGFGGAAFLEDNARLQQCEIFCDSTVISVEADNHKKVSAIFIKQHNLIKEITCQLVILTVGAKIASNFAQKAGIVCLNNGILVDDYMRTSEQNVFAGGDVCQVSDLLTGEKIQSSLWPDAVMQGITAAHSIAGISKRYDGSLGLTGSHLFGFSFVTAGNFLRFNNDTQGAYFKKIEKDDSFYHEYIYDTEHQELRGFSLFGNIASIGELRRQLQLSQSRRS